MAEELDFNAAKRLCASITHASLEKALGVLGETPAHWVEVRIDTWQPRVVDDALKIVSTAKALGKEVIATLREATEGGQWRGPLEEKLELLGKAVASGAAWVDLEESLLVENPEAVEWARGLPAGVGVIVSSHSPLPPPQDVPGPQSMGLGERRVLFKRVYTARSWGDNARVLAAVFKWWGSLVSFNMGPLGKPSRVMAPWMGAPFTYVYPYSLGKPAAPGQLSDLEMMELWRSLGFL